MNTTAAPIPQITRGPWTVEDVGLEDEFVVLVPYGEVARVDKVFDSPAEGLANAQAIAAVPEMIEALSRIFGSDFRDGSRNPLPDAEIVGLLREIAREALAKAKGGAK